MPFLSFPTVFPEGSIQTIISFLRGQGTDKWAAMEAAYELAGFALGQLRHPSMRGKPRRGGPMPSDADVANELEGLMQRVHHMQTKSPGKVMTTKPGEADKPESIDVVKTTFPVELPDWTAQFAVNFMGRNM